MGIDINRVISLTFVIGAALGAVAGVMVGSYYGIAHYQMGFLLGLKAFSAAVLGGIGNLAGAMLGGLLLGVIEALGAGYVGDLTNLCQLSGWSDGARASAAQHDPNLTLFGSNYQDVFAFLVLIAVLIFRPSGLLGERVARPRLNGARAMRSYFDTEASPRARVGRARADRASRCSCCRSCSPGIGTAWVRITNLAILFVFLALGLNIVVGFAGPARPRLHRVLRGRRLRLRAAREPALQPAPAVLDHPADRRRGRVPVRRAARRADAEAARRLPRDRHAGLRRDHPHLPQQPVAAGQHHQRPAGHHADRSVPHRRASASPDRDDRRAHVHRADQVLLPAAPAC